MSLLKTYAETLVGGCQMQSAQWKVTEDLGGSADQWP